MWIAKSGKTALASTHEGTNAMRANLSNVFWCIAACLTFGQTATAQDLKHPPALEIFARPDAIVTPVLSASGETAYYISHKGNATSLTLHDLMSKTRTEVPLTGPERAATGLKLIDETHLAISYPTKTATGAVSVSVLNLDTRQITPGTASQGLQPQISTSETQTFSGKDGQILGRVTYGDWMQYQFDDPELANIPTLAARAFENYRVRFVDFATDPRKLLLMTEGADDAGTYYFVDFAQDGFVELGKVRPNLKEEWISEKDALDYRARDGMALRGYLSLPPGREPHDLPLIIIAQSPEVREDLGLDPFVSALTTRGYAVFEPVVRGSSGHSDALQRAGNGEWGGKALTDIVDAVAYLKASDIVDDKRVCILGMGLGGYQALASIAFEPSQYRCAIDIAGISDPKSYLSYPDAAISSDTKALFGPQSQWDDLSPLNKAGNVTASVLIIHPKDITAVPASQSRQMARALKEAGRDVTLTEPALSPEASYEANLKSLKLIVDFLLKANAPY
jgi:dipeptidyl aminopeptidase/acylaminoacyl peptidase